MKTIGRRQFLRGSCGATLAIPFLPSLVRDAQAATSADPKNFVALGTGHGGVWGSNMYPDASLLTESQTYAGRSIRSGDLYGTVDAGNRVVSPVLQASESVLTPGLLAKINVLRGLDIPYYLAHHAGGHLGNFGENVGGSVIGTEMALFKVPTIDQVLAWSPTFYPDITNVASRSMVIGARGMSCGYASPSTQTGAVDPLPVELNNRKLFNRVFYPDRSAYGNNHLIVDRVLDMANSLRNHARISAGDRIRLDQHIERVYEVERRLTIDTGCGPTDPSVDSDTILYGRHEFNHNMNDQAEYAGLMNDIIVLALACGCTRIATLLEHYQFANETIGSWHSQVAHPATSDPTAQARLLNHKQGFFEHVFLDLASKLDATPTATGSLLDDTLVMWTQESGQLTHQTTSIPVVTAGGAGGFFLTGKYVDYRNESVDYGATSTTDTEHPGLIWNQLLGTVLQSMGLSPAEYELGIDIDSGDEVGGYGMHKVDSSKVADYVDAELVMSEPLPVIT